MNATKINKSRATNIGSFFNFHVLRFIVNVWTFIIYSNLNTILLLFAHYLQSAKKPHSSFRSQWAVFEGSSTDGNVEYEII